MAVTPTTTPPKSSPHLPTWKELVNQERKLLEGLVQLMRERSRRPPAEVEELVADALEKALQEIIAKEPDEERADELRRRAAARALARMFREGPRLAYTRPLPVQTKTVVARPDNNRHKREAESFQAMLDERRRRRPHLVVDNNTRPPARAA